jgi:hypothetical protein
MATGRIAGPDRLASPSGSLLVSPVPHSAIS